MTETATSDRPSTWFRLRAPAAILAVQIPLGAWWLSRYRLGPVEWAWRRLTYGRPI
jgi:uncharacterized protein